MIADAATVTESARRMFRTTTSGRELRPLDVLVVGDDLQVTFAGNRGDAGGPYGVRVTIPRDENDPGWTDHDIDDLDEWVMQAVIIPAMEAYDTTPPSVRRAASDGQITWLTPQ